MTTDFWFEFKVMLGVLKHKHFNLVNHYPDNKGFSWHAKNGEKRKTSEEIVSKSC